jgi:nitrogen regulatory protein PII
MTSMDAPFQTHIKARIEIIVEAGALRRVLDKLDALDVPGYTVFDAVAGRGGGGRWTADGTLTASEHMVMIVCVIDASRAETVLRAVYKLVSRQIAIVTLDEVRVVRAERF